MDVEFASLLRDGVIVLGFFGVAIFLVYRNRRIR